jgi:hypothetical protein
VYLILSLIDALSFPPVSSSKNADCVVTIGEPYGQNAAANPPETVVPLLARTVGLVLRDDASRIGEGELRHREGHPMLSPVLLILDRIPIEPRLRH